MKFKFLNLEFKNPLILASGPWWFGEEYFGKINFQTLGAVSYTHLTLPTNREV